MIVSHTALCDLASFLSDTMPKLRIFIWCGIIDAAFELKKGEFAKCQ